MSVDDDLAITGGPPALPPVEIVYQTYADDCYKFALRIVRDRDLAHDVVQDVFENLVRHPHRFEPTRGALLTWLLALTHNQAVDAVRWRRRRTRLDTADESVSDLRDPGLSPEDSTFLKVECERVLAALRGLGAAERQVLFLAHFCGYSQVEIARRTGLPLGTVKSRTRRGMRMLRTDLTTGDAATINGERAAG